MGPGCTVLRVATSAWVRASSTARTSSWWAAYGNQPLSARFWKRSVALSKPGAFSPEVGARGLRWQEESNSAVVNT